MKTDLQKLATALGPFTVDAAGYVWCNSAKGGKTVLANVRGWGYLTGQGSGALGLTDDAALKVQRDWGLMIAEALNAFAAGNGTSQANEDQV